MKAAKRVGRWVLILFVELAVCTALITAAIRAQQTSTVVLICGE